MAGSYPLNYNQGMTFFASEYRQDQAKILETTQLIDGLEFVRELINAMPLVAMVLNTERQIIYANQTLLSLLGDVCLGDIAGQRPGEALHCIHATDNPAGCGTSAACRHCGAIQTILQCQQTGLSAENECRISANTEDGESSYDFRVTARPFKVKDQGFIILTISDISDEKRRKVLERIFFHDIINSAGSLNGLAQMMTGIQDPPTMSRLADDLATISSMLINEILEQRVLTNAENGDLEILLQPVGVAEILKGAVATLQHHSVSHRRTLLVADIDEQLQVVSDPGILSRVVVNLLKNAYEATPADGVIRVEVQQSGELVSILVKNPGVMPAEIQSQLFQRSFSTRDRNRGLGTYSIKLFTTKYLQGAVSFVSNQAEQTVFRLDLPRLTKGK